MKIKFKISFTPAQKEIFFSESKARYTIVPKGRRFGATKGSSNAIIKWALKGITPMLWVDTINGNIERYYERYFLPILKDSGINFSFNYNKHQLTILHSTIDMRSADNPESIEGFGYKKIILNEAGIILKDNYLYTNTLLPMLIDYPDSQLYAIGTPKGKFKKDGSEHIFYQLSKRVGDDYRQLQYSSYDNPILDAKDIQELSDEIALLDPNMVRQEIYGEFIDMSAVNPFMTQYKAEKHESTAARFDPNKQLHIIIDFNLNPFSVIFGHNWRDAMGEHFHIVDEIDIKNGSIPEMIDQIKLRYGSQLPNCKLTGDAMGKRKEIAERDNASYYLQLQRGLGIRDSQLQLPANPSHENSRADCNYVLYHYTDFKINPKTCPGTARDMKIVQCDAFGKIIKSNRKEVSQQADFFDCFVGDTLITTDNGLKRIDEIEISDMVLTRNGFKEIIDKWNSLADVYEFTLSDNTTITCTKDHKFYVHGVGWCKIFSIFEENLSICKLKSFTAELLTLNTKSKNISIVRSRLAERNIPDAFTGKCGLILMEKYLLAMQFITKMGTRLITPLKTLRYSVALNIKAFIKQRGLKIILNGLRSWQKSVDVQQVYGMALKMELIGTNNTLKISGSDLKHLETINANTARKNILKNLGNQSSVQTNASQHTEENYFVKVKSVNYIGKRKVYDITVSGENEFYANGILVHNCVRYGINTFLFDWLKHHSKRFHK